MNLHFRKHLKSIKFCPSTRFAAVDSLIANASFRDKYKCKHKVFSQPQCKMDK